MGSRFIKIVLSVGAVICFSFSAFAEKESLVGKGGVGYWFYEEPPKPPKEIKVKKKKKKDEPVFIMQDTPKKLEDAKKRDCENHWTLECGFRTPKTFSEQTKMRDALMKDAYMHPNDAHKVLQMQKYMRWIVDQSIQASKLWKYNLVQNPELDPSVTNPISAYGLKLMTSVRKKKEKMVWDTIKEWGGKVIMFTKEDCLFCEKQAKPFYWLKVNDDVEVHGASLKGNCPYGVVSCNKGPKVLAAARMLNVKVVPSIYLYLPGNVWIRVSNGLVTTEELENRIYNFFIAWRTAVSKGLKSSNSAQPPMDFTTPKDMQEFQKLLMKTDHDK
ncbi:conjugal transfer protein TraF [Galenea microaerophila]